MKNIRSIKHTVEIHSNSTEPNCQVCGEPLNIRSGAPIAPAINHMLDHGYSILHIGGEWARDGEGKSIQHTIAILGTTRIPDSLAARRG